MTERRASDRTVPPGSSDVGFALALVVVYLLLACATVSAAVLMLSTAVDALRQALAG